MNKCVFCGKTTYNEVAMCYSCSKGKGENE
jgi:hypothetical protein